MLIHWGDLLKEEDETALLSKTTFETGLPGTDWEPRGFNWSGRLHNSFCVYRHHSNLLAVGLSNHKQVCSRQNQVGIDHLIATNNLE